MATFLSRRDVHRATTDTILSAIEAGAKEYKMSRHLGIARPVARLTSSPPDASPKMEILHTENADEARLTNFGVSRRGKWLRAR